MSAKPYNRPDTAFKHNGNAWHLFVDRTLKSRKSEKEEGDWIQGVAEADLLYHYNQNRVFGWEKIFCRDLPIS